MSRVLVTGGCGFLGACFVRRARGAGHTIVTADILPEADRALDRAIRRRRRADGHAPDTV